MFDLLRPLATLDPEGERWHFPPASRHQLLRDALGGDRIRFEDGGDGGDGDGDGDRSGSGDGDGSDGDAEERSGSGDGNDETISIEEARKLRRENKNLRDRAKTAEQKAAELEGKDLSTQEKLQRERDAEKTRAEQLAEQNRALRVKTAAIEAGIPPARVKAASALVDWDDVDADDESAIAQALKGLKKEHGYLFDSTEPKKPGDIDAGKRGRTGNDDDVKPGTGRLRHAYASART